MKKTSLVAITFAVFISLCCSMSVHAQSSQGAQQVSASLLENLKSGAITEQIKVILGNELIFWLALFAIFGFSARYGLQNIFPEMKGRGAIAASMAVVLTYSLFRVGIPNIIPMTKPVIFVASSLAIAFVLNSFKDKDKKVKIGFFPALIVGVLISAIFMGGFTLLGVGKTTETQTAPSSRLISTGTTGYSADPQTNYQRAREAIDRYDYAEAQEYFAMVISSSQNNPSNEWVEKTQEWITKSKGDLLFRHMAQHYPPLMEAEREAAAIMISKAEGLASVDSKRKELLIKARTLVEDVIAKEKLLAEEFNRRGA